MNIHDLEAFVAVVETGSIVAASARINLTQPGITRRIQNLEDSLGIALLDRQSKPLKPTAAGREAYEHGRRVLRSLDDLKAGVSPGGTIGGEFRLGIMPYLSEAALSAPLDELRSQFPQLTLRIVTGWSPQLVEQVAHSQLDAATVCLPEGVQPPEDVVGDALGVHSVIFAASPALGVPKQPRLEDLSQFPWIMNQSGCGFRAFIQHRFEADRLPFEVGVEAMSADLRMSLVARGLGIGIMTPAALADSRWRDAIEIIEAPDFSPKVVNWLVHRPPAGRLARPIETFGKALAETLKARMQLSA